MTKIRIIIKLKKNILDIQGKSIESVAKDNLAIKNILNVKQGKVIEFDISENDKNKIATIVHKICDKLLVNSIMEEYSFEILPQ